jgi:hypothetical protein
MKNVLVIGSCRVYTPCNKLKSLNVHRYPGGLVHTPRQIIQAIEIMNKQKVIKEEDFKDVFRIGKDTTINDIKDVQVNLSEYDKFIVELASLTDFATNNFICHSFRELISIPSTVLKYSLEELIDFLYKIHAGLGNKPTLFVQHNNFNKLNNLDRYTLGFALATYRSRRENVSYLDLIKIIAEYGAEKTLIDENHHTDFMIDKVRTEIANFVRG